MRFLAIVIIFLLPWVSLGLTIMSVHQRHIDDKRKSVPIPEDIIKRINDRPLFEDI